MWYKNVRAQNLLILAFSFIGLMGSVYVFSLNWELSLDEKRQIEATVFKVANKVEGLTSTICRSQAKSNS